MANPGDFAYTVKEQADIVRIIGDYVRLKKSGAQNFAGLCPFHGEKTPSFNVHATRQFFHCFGCGVSGDVFTFVQKIENITFPEAVRLVAQKCGIPLPKVQYSSPEEAREAKLRGALLDAHEIACKFFEDQLRRPEAAHAREYLSGRGLTAETIAQFRIGFAPDSGFLLRDRLKNEFDEETLKASGLLSWKAEDANPTLYSRFRNRVVFPICNESGRIIAFTGRTLSSDEKSGPKYLNSPETPIYVKGRVLFNLDKSKEAIRQLNYAILVEGQMDCISVFAAGFRNVVATSGTAFTDVQARLLGRFTKNIVVNFDPDTAGAAAAERSLALLVEEDFDIKVLTLDQGFDPDLYIRKQGRDAYVLAMKNAPRYFDYLIERARAQFPIRTAEGKVKALNFLLPHIQRVPSRIVRDELANEISQKLGIESSVLRQELRHVAGARTTQQLKAPAESTVTAAERIVVRALSWREQPEVIAWIRNAIGPDSLHIGLASESLVSVLLAADGTDPMALPTRSAPDQSVADVAANSTIPLPAAVAALSTGDPDSKLAISDHDRSLYAEIVLHEHEELTSELLEGAVAALRRRKFESRKRQLRAEIVEAERSQDSARLAQILQEQMEVERSLRELAGADRTLSAQR
jgi:DNA primase